jgi:hypothetical protein
MSSENQQHFNASNSTGGPYASGLVGSTVTVGIPAETVERKLEHEHNERAAKLFETQIGFLLGKVLTVIDASIPDREQKKAAKDLIRAQFHEQKRHVFALTTGAQLLSSSDGQVEV